MRLKIFCIALLAATAIALHPACAEGPRNIEFAGILWGLRQTSGPVDPGPNTFSNAEDQVWVDDGGRLHVRLQKRDGIWTASELMAKKDAGYGTYRFDVEGSIRDLDSNIVFGFFSWDQNFPPYFREIDIELSRWGNPSTLPGWFTVQPYDKSGNQHSFDLPKAAVYSFELRWEPGLVSFSCEADGNVVSTWRYAGEVPEPGRARLRINLWLFKGKTPDKPGPWEVVLSNMKISPLQ